MKFLRYFVTLAVALSLLTSFCTVASAGPKDVLKSPRADGSYLEKEVRHRGHNGLDNQGGPDGYAYRFVDNQSGDTATFSWVELRRDEDAIWLDFTANPDDDAAIIPLGFVFPFYGGPYDSVVITTNGMIQFYTTSPEFFNDCLPTEIVPAPMICVHWDDLHCDNGGYNPGGNMTIGYKQFPDHIVIEWDSVGRQGYTDASFKFEAILWADGRMKFQYDRLVEGTAGFSATIGIQADADGPALEYSCDATGHLPLSGLAIWFYPGDVGAISGSVRDVQGTPLPYARVRINELWVMGRTDATGDFAFPSVATGTYSMTAFLHGYMEGHATNVVVTTGGQTTVPFSLRWTGVHSYTASGNWPIADLDTTTVQLQVNESWIINDLDVFVSLTHSYVADLRISVTGPGGQTVLLTNQNGGSGEDYEMTTFDDEALIPVRFGQPPFNGSFIPEEPLSAFNGLDVQGAWTLTLEDLAGGDDGVLLEWGILITPALDALDPGTPATAREFALLGNYPNPFNSRTIIRYSVPQTLPISLRLYNVLGQEVATLLQARVEAGVYSVTWDGRDARGVDAASGLYLVRLESPTASATGKLFLLR
ncbi:carboxypeptidase regulatory-like domain-containing protein [bacterium]|nr:carboxypeptidase regulatory-like domain-containing protein [bacterium]MBU1984146.1 carboxypeptidase regulatory-like domain-containing protein [bacterium]